MKKAQYRKYKEIYQVNLDIIKKAIKDCDNNISEYNKYIFKYNNKQKGGKLKNIINDKDILYLLIPNNLLTQY